MMILLAIVGLLFELIGAYLLALKRLDTEIFGKQLKMAFNESLPEHLQWKPNLLSRFELWIGDFLFNRLIKALNILFPILDKDKVRSDQDRVGNIALISFLLLAIGFIIQAVVIIVSLNN